MKATRAIGFAMGGLANLLLVALAASDSGGTPSPGTPPTAGDATGMTDIHDIKPAIAMGAAIPLWVWLLAAVILLAVLVIWLVYRRRKRSSDEIAAFSPVPPDVQALNDLDVLAAETDPDGKRFYFRLSAILRTYVEGRYGIASAEMTTEELLPAVERLEWPGELKHTLSEFCRASDPVKFAEQPARNEAMANHLAFVRRLVAETREVDSGDQDDTETTPDAAMDAPSAARDTRN